MEINPFLVILQQNVDFHITRKYMVWSLYLNFILKFIDEYHMEKLYKKRSFQVSGAVEAAAAAASSYKDSDSDSGTESDDEMEHIKIKKGKKTLWK